MMIEFGEVYNKKNENNIENQSQDFNRMYEIYLDNILLPIAPEKIDVKATNMNKTYDLVNGSQYNFLKLKGLKTISFSALIPTVKYPFATYKNNEFKEAKDFIEEFKNLENSKKPFKLKIIRGMPYDDNIKVSLEEFTINETFENLRDIVVDFTFKEFKELEVKEIKNIETSERPNTINTHSFKNNETIDNNNFVNDEKPKAVVTKTRPISRKKSNIKSKNYKSKKNLVQTTRNITGSSKNTDSVKSRSGIHSNIEPMPILVNY